MGSPRWWIGIALALAAGLLLLAASVTWTERRVALDHGRSTARQLVAILEQHASRSLESVDYALRLTVDGWQRLPAGPLDAETAGRMLRRSLLDSPPLRGISVFGPDGKRLFSSDSSHSAPLDISGRAFFAELKNDQTDRLVISAPVQSSSTGGWVIPVARPLRGPEGQFAGAIGAAVKAEYFVELYGASELGATGTISLLNRDGLLLAHMAGSESTEYGRLGELPVPRPTLLALLAHSDHGEWDQPAQDGKVDRLFSFRASATLPIVAIVALGRDEALAGWRSQAWRTMISASALALLIVLFTLRLAREMARSKSAYTKLSRAEARLRDAIDVLPEHLMIFDAEDRLVLCNEAVRRTDSPEPNWSSLGLTFEEILRARLAMTSSAGKRPRGFFEARLEHHRNPTTPMEVHTPAGRSLQVTERRTAEGGIVSLRVDVTELHKLANELRHAKAEAERANLVKSEFLTALGHEIRTPLNGIIGFAELLLAADLTAAHHNQLMHIRTAGQGLLALANDMLDLSKIEAGRTDVASEEFDIAALVDDCAALITPSAAAKGLAVLCELDPALPRRATGAACRLRQVLINLLGNAVKFTDEGEVRLGIRPELGTGRIEFTVRDTGIGIAEHEMPHLFKRFVQLGEPARRAGGAGLGLAISHVLVELMGGELTVASVPGRGSLFRFAIALAPSGGSQRAPVSAPAPIRPARILLAEDAPVNQELAKAIVAAAGHQLDIVGDGTEAVAFAHAYRYDLILMDVQLPCMDGLSAAREIRRLEPAHDRTPIIALTAGVSDDDRALSVAAELDGHLTKPFDAPTLLAIIARYAGRRSRADSSPDLTVEAH